MLKRQTDTLRPRAQGGEHYLCRAANDPDRTLRTQESEGGGDGAGEPKTTKPARA